MSPSSGAPIPSPPAGLPRPATAAIAATAALCALTIATAVLVAVVPGLGELSRELLPARLDGRGVKHTLTGAAGIFLNNLLIVGAIVLLTATRPHATRPWRIASDVVVVSIVLRSALLVGIVLGGQGTALLPFLVHLPFEWAALGLAAGIWLYTARVRPLSLPDYGRPVAVVALLLAVAALLETFTTPR